LQQKLEVPRIEIEVARQEQDELADHLEELESGTVCTKNGQKYINDAGPAELVRLVRPKPDHFLG
jgi:hypothetical protein